jgi:hypothetical protein
MNSYKRIGKNKYDQRRNRRGAVPCFKELKKVKQMVGAPQMRLPFSMNVN